MMLKIYLTFVAVLVSCSVLAQTKSSLSSEVNFEVIEQHEQKCKDTRSTGCLVLYKGEVISEWYPDSLQNPGTEIIRTRSAVKSWISLLAGMLQDQGKLDIDDPVAKYIPEWEAGVDSGVTIRHLLTMTSGLKQRTVAAMRNGGPPVIQSAENQNEFAFSMPLEYSTGERWSYSNEGVQLLSPILERAAEMPLHEFAKKYLFEPLEMTNTELMVDDFGNTVTYAGAATTVNDFAKIGQLILNKGYWDGKQLISEEQIELFTSPINQMKNYGYLWWLDPNTNSIAAMGSQDNACIIYPDLELVVVRMQKESYPDGNGNWMSPKTVQMLRYIVE